MAGKRSQTTLTFSVTVPQPEGAKIPDVRKTIVDSIRSGYEADFEKSDIEVKCHLTNKETKYA